MLASPHHAVIGCSDLEVMTRYLSHFGHEIRQEGELPEEAARELYGLERSCRQRVLAAPAATSGWLRLVETPTPVQEVGPYDRGPLAIDFYTRNTARSLELVRQADGRYGETVAYEVGPLEVEETDTLGPDALRIVFLQINRGRPSLLDSDPERLHSELHSIVWTVASMDTALTPWVQAGGLTLLNAALIEGPTISRLLGLPRPEVPIRFALAADREQTPARLELIEFPQDEGANRATWPLVPGLHAAVFFVGDLDDAMEGLDAVELGTVVEIVGGGRAVSGVAAGGVRFELWEEG
jgi:hypothetical protein